MVHLRIVAPREKAEPALEALDSCPTVIDARGTFTASEHSLWRTIGSPAFFAGFVAFCAGVAGMLSLTTAKSGA